MEERAMYTVAEASKHLGVSKVTLYNLLRGGSIGHVRLPGKGPTSKIRIPKDELDGFVKASTVHGYEPANTEAVEARLEALSRARKAASEKRAKKASTRSIGAFLEDPTGTIYALALRPRTFNVLWKNGLVKIEEVDITNPEIAKKIVSLKRFGVSCYNDLESRLRDYHMRHDEVGTGHGVATGKE